MIYIFDNTTNREKVVFSNALKNAMKVPPLYIHYYYPLKEVMKNIKSTNLGLCSLGGDDLLTETTDINLTSLDSFFEKKDKFDAFKEVLESTLKEKINKIPFYQIMIDGIYDKDVLDTVNKLCSLDNIVIVKSSLAKDKSIINDDWCKDFKTFTINFKENGDLSELEKEILELNKTNETKVLKIEEVTVIDQPIAA